MVTLEQAACPEWNEIEVFAEEALMLITSHQIGDRIDPYVIKFLDDVEIRRTEKTFGEHQRKMVMRAIQPLKT
ncbi:MAG: hypothetical protein J0I47_15590 [Sphingomonas sp.]|uniref:hypothetical protein n=1 Tax=Sphingomonas sp. TaxID=28214 RepID=UPI001AD2573E|nr:hypothetical protein [Sphingomonas sp.]MBN8809641.1 hypothetical protein [Sphingomonas sp.]